MSGATPPSTSMWILRSPIMRFTRATLSSIAGMNAWPPKPGIDGHHQDQVEPVEHIFDRALRRRGIERHARLLAERADLLQRAVEMPGRLGVNGDVVGARLGEGFEIGVAGLDHQVAVERLVGMRPQRRDHRRAEGDVGHEMPVHHVEVDPVGAGRRDRAHLLAEPREVRRQNRWRHDHRAGHAPISFADRHRWAIDAPQSRWSPAPSNVGKCRSVTRQYQLACDI